MAIILSGGGTESSIKITKKFLSLVKGKKLIGVIANAREIGEYESTLNWVKSKLFPKNHKYTLKLIELNDVKLDAYDGIIISGGNTFKLLADINKSNYREKLIEYIKSGKSIYGISAGAIIMGANISTAYITDKNKIKLDNLSGLNLFNGASFMCHYKKSYSKEVKKYLSEKIPLIIAFPEGNGIIQTHNGEEEYVGNIFSFKS